MTHLWQFVLKRSSPAQLDFLIAAKLMHLVPDIVFEALDVLVAVPATNKCTISCGTFAMKKVSLTFCASNMVRRSRGISIIVFSK